MLKIFENKRFSAFFCVFPYAGLIGTRVDWTDVQCIRKRKLNKCAMNEKMLILKFYYANINSRRKLIPKLGMLYENAKEEIPGMICVNAADEKF